jgi:hypothetical protein
MISKMCHFRMMILFAEELKDPLLADIAHIQKMLMQPNGNQNRPDAKGF